MFDPTAFDNMKVVVEGVIYDLDLSGDINIIDRKDMVDLAKMSRHYALSFTTKRSSPNYAAIRLEANIEQLSAELLELKTPHTHGAYVYLTFTWKDSVVTKENYEIVQQLWGINHTYDQRRVVSSLYGIKEEIVIDFNRLVTEEMLDDLTAMIDLTVRTLNELK